VIVSGALSHELVSLRFRASGAARVARAVALTFDDGPSARYTPRILVALTRLRVRATFFLVGYLAEANPDLVRRELRLGMTVGNHSYNHPEVPPFDQLPPRLLADEIALGGQILSRLGAQPRLCRVPVEHVFQLRTNSLRMRSRRSWRRPGCAATRTCSARSTRRCWCAPSTTTPKPKPSPNPTGRGCAASTPTTSSSAAAPPGRRCERSPPTNGSPTTAWAAGSNAPKVASQRGPLITLRP
jgi:hypothetical protein